MEKDPPYLSYSFFPATNNLLVSNLEFERLSSGPWRVKHFPICQCAWPEARKGKDSYESYRVSLHKQPVLFHLPVSRFRSKYLKPLFKYKYQCYYVKYSIPSKISLGVEIVSFGDSKDASAERLEIGMGQF